MTGLFFASFGLGIAFCAPPGVVTAESLRRGLAGGFWAALRVQLGSLIGDATWALIALSGAAFLVQNDFLRLFLGVAGVLVLLYLAGSAFRDAGRGSLPVPGDGAGRGDFLSGALLSLGNPFAIAFWLGVGSAAITSRVAQPQLIHYVVFLLSFLLGALLWAFFLAGLIAWGQRVITARFFRIVNMACGLFLLFFALQLGWNLWSQ